MMSRNAIIEALFTGKNFTDCINKMEPDHLREDLRQEVILIVCEIPEEKIIGLHQRKQLDFFVVKIILNQIKSSSSPFAKKYRQQNVEFRDTPKDVGLGDVSFTGEVYSVASIAESTKHFCSDSLDEKINLDERELRELIEDMAIEEVDKQYWYNKGLIELYKKHGNYRAIERETGIPYISAYKTIQKSFKEIKQKVSR
jgi:hypothetical protein